MQPPCIFSLIWLHGAPETKGSLFKIDQAEGHSRQLLACSGRALLARLCPFSRVKQPHLR
jgi:hypothetical protein